MRYNSHTVTFTPLRYEIHSSPVCLQGSPAIACMLSLFSRVPLCDPMDCSPPGSSVHGNSPDKHTGVGCHALLQGTFLTQGLNPGLPHCRWILYRLSHQGSPINCIAKNNSTYLRISPLVVLCLLLGRRKDSSCQHGHELGQ